MPFGKNMGNPLVSVGPGGAGFVFATADRKGATIFTMKLLKSSFARRRMRGVTFASVDGSFYAAWVELEGKTVVTVGELEKVRLLFDKESDDWRALWPVPLERCRWRAISSTCQPPLCPSGLGPVAQGSFPSVVSRTFNPMPAGFAVLPLEGLGSFYRFRGSQRGRPPYRRHG
jgi:hypothetical protein